MTSSELLSDTDFLCGSTSATYATVDKFRNINIKYNEVSHLIWSSASGWQYDDSNATTLPIATTSMTNNQQDYSLPTDAQRVYEVTVKDNGGTWHKLQQVDWDDMHTAPPNFATGGGLPLYYKLLGRSCLLYPSPLSANTTLSAGLAFYVDRNVTELPTSATTLEPGFARPFHRILSYAAAIDFLKDPSMLAFYEKQRTRLETGLTNFYTARNIEGPGNIKPKGKSLWRQYL